MNTWFKSTNFIWCPGCPANWLAPVLAQSFDKLGIKKENLWLVSGIGCTARIANYFACRTVHTTHGRAIAVAEGIKLADPKKDVFVVSGDGDLLSIGLSHLIHTARRNTAIKVICINNFVYGMTGGQTSPTTAKGKITKTAPAGAPYLPIQPSELFASFKNVYFGRTIVYNNDHFFKTLKKAYQHKGFSFVEVISFCRINDLRFKNAKDINEEVKKFLEENKTKISN